ncbi:hypothetical protein IMCC26134_00795 [Verrucomicrobia bacterium IMCC26134]|nr:hypothetical protein IMCC26134_00795 [Verrucomicrobia bacterium IMCC26134]
MLNNIKDIYGHKLVATDGYIGEVKDCYFDDQTWTVRYLVVNTGTWLEQQLVLLSPHAFGHFDPANKLIYVNLTRKQIEDCPSIDKHRPVSRQYEQDYYSYYGWPAYWNGGGIWGYASYPIYTPPFVTAHHTHHGQHPNEDEHLRSTRAITGYAIAATDGQAGTVINFLMDDKSWSICDLVVQTGHWYAGKQVYIAPAQIDRISYEESTVFVKLTKSDIQHTAEHRIAHAHV